MIYKIITNDNIKYKVSMIQNINKVSKIISRYGGISFWDCELDIVVSIDKENIKKIELVK